MKGTHIIAVTVFIVMAFSLGTAAAGETTVGVIRLCLGAATVTRDGREIPATTGMRLNEKDILKTGADGSMGVILRDDSLISLAPGTGVTMTRFAFAPEADNLALNLNVSKGKVVIRTGKIAKIAPKAVKLQTPAMVMGVRGTTFAVAVN